MRNYLFVLGKIATFVRYSHDITDGTLRGVCGTAKKE